MVRDEARAGLATRPWCHPPPLPPPPPRMQHAEVPGRGKPSPAEAPLQPSCRSFHLLSHRTGKGGGGAPLITHIPQPNDHQMKHRVLRHSYRKGKSGAFRHLIANWLARGRCGDVGLVNELPIYRFLNWATNKHPLKKSIVSSAL